MIGDFGGEVFFIPEYSVVSLKPDLPEDGFRGPTPGSLKQSFLGEQERGELHPIRKQAMGGAWEGDTMINHQSFFPNFFGERTSQQ